MGHFGKIFCRRSADRATEKQRPIERVRKEGTSGELAAVGAVVAVFTGIVNRKMSSKM